MSNCLPVLISPEARSLTVRRASFDEMPGLLDTLSKWQEEALRIIQELQVCEQTADRERDVAQMNCVGKVCRQMKQSLPISYVCTSEQGIEGMMTCSIESLEESKYFMIEWLCTNPKNIKLKSMPNSENQVANIGKNCLRKALDRAIREDCEEVCVDYYQSSESYYLQVVKFFEDEKYLAVGCSAGYRVDRYIKELDDYHVPLSEGKIQKIAKWLSP